MHENVCKVDYYNKIGLHDTTISTVIERIEQLKIQ